MCEGFPSPSPHNIAANSLSLPLSLPPSLPSPFITSRALTPSLFSLSLLSRPVSFPRFAQQAQPRIPPASTPLRVYISGVFIRDRAFFVLVVTEPTGLLRQRGSLCEKKKKKLKSVSGWCAPRDTIEKPCSIEKPSSRKIVVEERKKKKIFFLPLSLFLFFFFFLFSFVPSFVFFLRCVVD